MADASIRLQKYITGLLGSLYVAGGDGPDSLAKTVTPSIDVTDFFFASEMSISVASSAGLVASDTGPSIVQPQAEIWRVFGMSSAIAASAPGAVVGVSHFMQNPPLTSGQYQIMFPAAAPRTITGTAGVTERADFGGLLPVPLITMPGTVFQSALTVAPGGAITLTLVLHMLYQRLKS